MQRKREELAQLIEEIVAGLKRVTIREWPNAKPFVAKYEQAMKLGVDLGIIEMIGSEGELISYRVVDEEDDLCYRLERIGQCLLLAEPYFLFVDAFLGSKRNSVPVVLGRNEDGNQRTSVIPESVLTDDAMAHLLDRAELKDKGS